MKLVGSFYVVMATMVSLIFIYFGQELIGVASLGNHEYLKSLRYIPFLIFAQIIYGSYMVFDYGIQVRNKTKYYAYVCLVTLLINLPANYFGIMYFGVSSVPLIKLTTYTLYFLMIYIISQRLYHIPFERRSFIILILSIAMVSLYLVWAINLSFIYRFIILFIYCFAIIGLFINKNESAKLLSYISKKS